MIVWRFEHKDGIGPYQHDECDIDTRGGDNPVRPGPITDGVFSHGGWTYDYRNFVFGFKDKTQALAWFPEIEQRRELKRCGTDLVTYKVNKRYVRFGGHQLAFPKDKATKIGVDTYDTKGDNTNV